MHGLSHVVGIGPRVTINGKSYQVRGKTNRFYAELEAELVKLRGDPFDMIVEAGRRGKLDDDPELLGRVAQTVTMQFRNWRVMNYGDYLDFLNSPRGDALLVYHCLKKDAPELTLDDIQHVLAAMKLSFNDAYDKEVKELFDAIRVASGEDHLGNLNGRLPTPETPAQKEIQEEMIGTP